ncbi:peptidylprolyl isomerase [Cohnella terricola]|uniref:peptidylprolyl isomerase n=1 Tax=Cohnella terricola TaxID=1289167 RepID=A0A559J7I8_9BACL|nr:peptidylprolyl isomerase [Cohnella terricola]TVX95817.1 peptidylprolyl isomerase [Cohnella terricola]
MRETIRRKPLVLLALLATLTVSSGCSPNSSIAPTASGPSEKPAENEIVAMIGGTAISRQQLNDRLLASYGSQTLRSMMLEAAVSKETRDLGIEVADEELERELSSMMQGYEDEAAFYRTMYEQLGMNKEEVREDARYRLLLEKLSIRNVTVEPAEIDRYIEEHREEFQPDRKYQLAQIVVQTKELATGLLGKLTQGENFAELARTYSIDEFTADSGGELGWIEANDPFVDESVLAEAASMQVGEIAGPIPTDLGYAIIRLDARSALRSRPEEEIRLEARKQLALGKAMSMRDLEEQLLNKYGAEVKDPSLKR